MRVDQNIHKDRNKILKIKKIKIDFFQKDAF